MTDEPKLVMLGIPRSVEISEYNRAMMNDEEDDLPKDVETVSQAAKRIYSEMDLSPEACETIAEMYEEYPVALYIRALSARLHKANTMAAYIEWHIKGGGTYHPALLASVKAFRDAGTVNE